MQTDRISWLSMIPMRLQALPAFHKKLLLSSGLLVGAALLWPGAHEVTPQRIPLHLDIEALLPQVGTEPSVVEVAGPDFERVIQSGDTLSVLFQKAGVGQQTHVQGVGSRFGYLGTRYPATG